jgi:hypothetical protein
MKVTNLLLLALLTLTACSQKGTDVRLELSHNFVFGGAATPAEGKGGLMVWGTSATGAAFGRVVEDGSMVNLQLPPGSWTFFVMGWDGTKDYNGAMLSPGMSMVFGGVVRCGRSAPTEVGGDKVTVQLSLSNSGCDDPAFKGAGTFAAGNLLPFKPVFCSDVAGVTSATRICGDTSDDPRRVAAKAPIGSYRVALKNFFSLGGPRIPGTDGLRGACVPFFGDADGGADPAPMYGLSSATIPNLPAGGPNLPFCAELEMFPGNSDCNAGGVNVRPPILKVLPDGIAGGTFNSRYFVTGPAHRHYFTVAPAAICAGRKLPSPDGTPFAAGDGSLDRPYAICNVKQWYALGATATLRTQAYKLQANLDFNPYSKGLGLSLGDPLEPCLDLGTNFIPVGAVGTCVSGDLTWGTTEAFSGALFGSGFALRNLRFRNNDRPRTGLFAHLEGTDVIIRDLHLDTVELEGVEIVGALAGSAKGLTAQGIKLDNIRITNVDLRARQNMGNSRVGGVAGTAEDVLARRITVEKGHIEADGSLVGGVFGFVNLGQMRHVAASLDLHQNSFYAGTEAYGGVAGKLSGSYLEYAKFEGGIFVGATRIGGIAGHVDGSTVKSVYAAAYIRSHLTTAIKTGGLFGDWDSSLAVGPGYSLSYVKSNCFSACQQGPIAGVVTTTPVTQLALYKLGPGDTGEKTGAGSFESEALRTLAQLRDPTQTTALTDAAAPAVGWRLESGHFPRLDFEKHPCAGTQAGAGTLLSPKLICNEAEYFAMEGTSGTHFKLAANIRLPNGLISTNDIPTFSKHLDGDGNGIVGGKSVTSVGAGVGHIGTNSGSIRNLRVLGLTRVDSAAGTAAAPGAVFVAVNSGLIANVEANVTGEFFSHAGLLVGRNTGTIRDVKLDGDLGAGSWVAPLAFRNDAAGEVADVVVGAGIRSTTAAGSNFAGLAIRNDGKILRTTVRSRLHDSSGMIADQVSMLVDENGASGLIEDVLVADEASFNVHGATAYYFHRTNAGALNRVANFGEVVRHPPLSSTTVTNFPTGNGTALQAVVRAGGRSGVKILSGEPYTCFSTDTIEIASWSSAPDAENWDALLETNSGYNAWTLIDKKLVVDVKRNDGTRFIQQVIGFDPVTERFQMAQDLCTGGPANVSVYWSNDIPVDATGAPVAGVFLPQGPLSLLGAAWINRTYVLPADEPQMLAYYSFLFGITGTPVAPRAWEYHDEGLELFEQK